MSEYQYYEFLAIDQTLDDRQQQELRAWSTRARITPTSFVNTYDWGDFKGDPRELMARYFDAFLYLANWGTRQLMVRLPAPLLDLEMVSRYCASDAACGWSAGDQVIVAVTTERSDDAWEEGAEEALGAIVPVRSELAGGDRRFLYLAWLVSVDAGEVADHGREPPVPPGLGALSVSLQRVVEFLRIDEDLLWAAAQASESLRSVEALAADLTQWVIRLPDHEKDALLGRLISGEPHLQEELTRRFRSERHPVGDGPGVRTVAELREAARRHAEQRAQLVAQRRADEQARRERDQAAARQRHLAALARRQDQAWQQVDAAIATRQPAQYDEAVELLQDLRAVSAAAQRLDVFDHRLGDLRQRHAKKTALLQRLEQADLGAGPLNAGTQR